MSRKRLPIDTSCSSDVEKSEDKVTYGSKEDHSDGCEVETLLDPEDSKHETENGQVVQYEDNTYKAPDGDWGWFVVLGAFLNHVILGGVQRSSGVFYLQLLDRFGQSATATSWVLALCSTLTLITSPLVSALCSRFSIRFVVYLGGVLAMVGVLTSAFSPNIIFMYFTYSIVSGIGRSMAYSPCLVIVSHYFNKRRGLAIGLASCGGGVGSFILPPMLEKLFDFYGFTGTFLVLAAIYSHFFISGALFRSLELHRRLKNIGRKTGKPKPIPRQNKNLNPSSENNIGADNQLDLSTTNTKSELTTTAKSSNEHQEKPSYISRRLSEFKLAIKKSTSGNEKPKKARMFELSLFRNYAFTTLCIQLLTFTVSMAVTFVFLPALAKTRGLTKIEGAYLVSIMGISDALSRILMSTLLDLKNVKKFRLIIYNILMLVAGMVCNVIPLMKDFGQFAAISVVYGMVSGTLVSQKSVVLVDILGVDKLSSSFGLLLLFQGVGALIGPVIGALFKDFMGSYDMSFYFGSIGIFIGGIMLASGNVWLHIQRKKATKHSAANV